MVSKQVAEARRQKRLFESGRHKLQRALPKAVRQVAKGSGWRVSQGMLFREHEGWFISVFAAPYITESRTPADLHCKPMALDPLFWKIVGLDENVDRPLSFRALGTACGTPALREADIPEHGGSPERMAEALLRWANAQLQALNGTLSLDAFIQFIREYPNERVRASHSATLITALLLQGDYEGALAVCSADNVPFGGGFIFMRPSGSKSFIDLAIDWITNARHAHTVN
jgi:hypothetical protein